MLFKGCASAVNQALLEASPPIVHFADFAILSKFQDHTVKSLSFTKVRCMTSRPGDTTYTDHKGCEIEPVLAPGKFVMSCKHKLWTEITLLWTEANY